MSYSIMKIMVTIPLLLLPIIGHADGDTDVSVKYRRGYAKAVSAHATGSNEVDSYAYDDYRGEQVPSNYQQRVAYEPQRWVYRDAIGCEEWGDDCECICCSVPCCGTGFFSADLLYWRPFEGGLDICVPTEDTNTTVGSLVTSTFQGRGRDPDFKWRPGFRVGAGYRSANDDWDIGAFWTYFHSHAQSGNDLRWNIDFGVVDVVTGYRFDVLPCVYLRPFCGLRGARIYQKLRIQSSTTALVVDNNSKQEFWGLGPLVGLEGDWALGCGFSLYSSGSVSWLYGSSHLRLIESSSSTDAISSCNVRSHLNTTLVSADASLGVRWSKCFCGYRRLVLQCGLEHHHYFDYNGFCDGDLSFDGATFSAGVEF